MTTMQTVVLIAHTFIAILIIVLVLLQRGKGADAGAAFGAGASGTVFGARGSSSFFSRATGFLAAAFFASSLTLAYMSGQQADAPTSLIERTSIMESSEDEPATEDTGSEAEALPDIPELEDTGEDTGDEAASGQDSTPPLPEEEDPAPDSDPQ